MRRESSNFVKVFFANKEKVLRQLNDYSESVRRGHSEVEKVGYFGSYANDTYGPASDVDLLIILRSSSKLFLDRIPEFLPDDVSICCDVFPYTFEEIEKMKQDGNPWIRHVLKEVVWL